MFLAHKLHTPLQELQAKTTSNEFLEWNEYFQEEANQIDPIRAYLAQIALEIRRSYVKKPKRFKLVDFFLRFVPPRKELLTDKDKTEYLSKSKAAWLWSTGLAKKK